MPIPSAFLHRPCRAVSHIPLTAPLQFPPSPTDFDEMEQLFSKEINPNLDMEELNACLNEFRNDYNKVHFVRNETFKVRSGGARRRRGRGEARRRCCEVPKMSPVLPTHHSFALLPSSADACSQAAADKVTGETRRIFIEFLERSCTAEFSGFLLYKELARRMKASSPEVAEM